MRLNAFLCLWMNYTKFWELLKYQGIILRRKLIIDPQMSRNNFKRNFIIDTQCYQWIWLHPSFVSFFSLIYIYIYNILSSFGLFSSENLGIYWWCHCSYAAAYKTKEQNIWRLLIFSKTLWITVFLKKLFSATIKKSSLILIALVLKNLFSAEVFTIYWELHLH